MAVVTGTKFKVNDELYYIDKRLDLRKSIVKNIDLTVYGSGNIIVVYNFDDGSSIYEDRCYRKYKDFYEELKHNFTKFIDKELNKLSKPDNIGKTAIGLPEIIKAIIKQ